jgi:uncharacterized protein YrrD
MKEMLFEDLNQHHQAQYYVGKPVISTIDGKQIGSVEDVFIDPESLEIPALVISKGNLLRRKVEAIPIDQVKIWGEDALLIKGTDVVLSEEDLPDLDDWIYASDLRARSVITLDGNRIGELDDLLIDSMGEITGFQVAQGYSKDVLVLEGFGTLPTRLPLASLRSIGQDALVIELEKISVSDET